MTARSPDLAAGEFGFFIRHGRVRDPVDFMLSGRSSLPSLAATYPPRTAYHRTLSKDLRGPPGTPWLDAHMDPSGSMMLPTVRAATSYLQILAENQTRPGERLNATWSIRNLDAASARFGLLSQVPPPPPTTLRATGPWTQRRPAAGD